MEEKNKKFYVDIKKSILYKNQKHTIHICIKLVFINLCNARRHCLYQWDNVYFKFQAFISSFDIVVHHIAYKIVLLAK